LPITGPLLEEYKVVRDDLVKMLNSVQYRTHHGLEKLQTAS
jgi:hypothetical protein